MRRPLFALAAAVLVVAQCWLMLNDVAAWRGVWPMASAAVSAPWLFLGPAAAGLSAYEAVQRTQQDAGGCAADTVAWRSSATAMLVARVVLACVVVSAGAACAVVVNLTGHAPAGFLWPSYLVVTVAFAIGSVAVGMALGRLGGPLWFAPVVAMLATFLRAAWFQGAAPGSADDAFTRIFLSGRPWVELNPHAVVASVVETVFVVVLALVAPVLATRARARRSGCTFPGGRGASLRAATGAVVMVGCAALVLTSPPVVRYRTAPSNIACSDTHPRVCVWPENAQLLPQLAEKAARADTVAQTVHGQLMTQIDEFGLSHGDSFLAMGQGTWFFSDTLAGAIAGSLAPVRCDPPQDDPGLWTYWRAQSELSALFQLQIEDRPRPPGYGDSSGIDIVEVTGVWQASPSVRNTWVADRVATMEALNQGWCG
ncbi:MAG: hypothetical protein FWE61_08600 [Micrococcales bacterium]|nr:hypothetical protein [Micrococcales bacterium]